MSAEIAHQLGLRRPPLLVGGGHDQACAALGSGIVAPGLAMVSTGTAEVVEVALDQPVVVPPLQHAGISVYRHVVPGLYLAMTLNHSGGILLRWLRDTLGKWEAEQARAAGVDAYELLLKGAPAGPAGLLVLPHFAGSGTPSLDTASRGAILGLTTSTSLATLTKALLEGLTFELRQNLDLLRTNGVAINELRAVGGGARSPLWLQLKADICNVSLRTVESTEAACLGAAMLAGRAAGLFDSLAEAADMVVHLVDEVQPQPGVRAAYEPWHALYTTMYPQLRGLLHAVAAEAGSAR
jgi:xylulokinase